MHIYFRIGFGQSYPDWTVTAAHIQNLGAVFGQNNVFDQKTRAEIDLFYRENPGIAKQFDVELLVIICYYMLFRCKQVIIFEILFAHFSTFFKAIKPEDNSSGSFLLKYWKCIT